MVSFLLTWNPRRSARSDQAALIDKLRRGEPATSRWGVRTKAIAAGDQLFLVRLGKPPKGIFGRATAMSASYRDLHWDETKRAEGKTALFVKLQFIELLDTGTQALITLDELAGAPFNQVNWCAQGSGHFIPDDVAAALASQWEQHLATVGCQSSVWLCGV